MRQQTVFAFVYLTFKYIHVKTFHPVPYTHAVGSHMLCVNCVCVCVFVCLADFVYMLLNEYNYTDDTVPVFKIKLDVVL